MTPRERKYHINKRLRKLLWEEITRVIDEDILNQLNGGESNPDIETFKTKYYETIYRRTSKKFIK